MPTKLRISLLAVAVLTLAAAAYLGVTLALSPAARQAMFLGAALPGARRDYSLIPAVELPTTQAELFGAVVAVHDHSLMTRPITKSSGDNTNPLVEVVVTGATKVYLDTTSDRTGTIVDGKLQQTLEPFDVSQIAPADTLVAWGARRGDRLTAAVLVDERNH